MRRPLSPNKLTYAILVIALLPWPSTGSVGRALAEPSEAVEAERQTRSPDFLFGRPAFSIGIRGQWVRQRAESEIYDFTTDLLTLDKRDFDAPGLGVDVGLPLTSRLDAVVGFEFARTSTASEYRDFVDTDGLPIEQTTSFTQVNLSGSIELAALPRGRAVGQQAWVPASVVPYIGAGGGFLWYRLNQQGDFVDFVDLSIFTDRFESNGWTPSAHVFGGVDIKLARHLYLTTEVRYLWAMTEMSRDFLDFDPIDLAGLRIGAGVQFLF